MKLRALSSVCQFESMSVCMLTYFVHNFCWPNCPEQFLIFSTWFHPWSFIDLSAVCHYISWLQFFSVFIVVFFDVSRLQVIYFSPLYLYMALYFVSQSVEWQRVVIIPIKFWYIKISIIDTLMSWVFLFRLWFNKYLKFALTTIVFSTFTYLKKKKKRHIAVLITDIWGDLENVLINLGNWDGVMKKYFTWNAAHYLTYWNMCVSLPFGLLGNPVIDLFVC